jgi:hypothetical protein
LLNISILLLLLLLVVVVAIGSSSTSTVISQTLLLTSATAGLTGDTISRAGVFQGRGVPSSKASS